MPLISIIVPVHNREDLLSETLDSILAQTVVDWECIIVDDHSTDASLSVAERYIEKDSRFSLLILPDGKRLVSAALNYGLAHANGAFINFLHSDDLFATNKLARQMAVFNRQLELDVVGCRYARFSVDPAVDAYQVPFSPPEAWIEYLLANQSVYLWHAGCPLWRTEAVKKIGAWDETISSWEDPELDLRSLSYGLNLHRIEEILYYLRRNNDPNALSNRPYREKHSIKRRAILKGWRVMRETGEVSNLHRRLFADNFLKFAWTRVKTENLWFGLNDWIKDSQHVGQGWFRTFLGIILLLSNKYRAVNYFGRHLRMLYFKHREQLPPPLPFLEDFPIVKFNGDRL